jgi:hypothetical protein
MSGVDYINFREGRAEEILGLNLWQFNESEALNKLLQRIAEIQQDTLRVIVDVGNGWLLTRAEGSQLDYLGDEIGVPRGPYTDEEYKLLQLLVSKFRNGSVTQDGVIEAIRVISGDAPVDIYRGNFKNIDITFFADCRSSLVVGREIKRLLPLVSSVRLLAKKGIPFGFRGDPNTLGFGTVSGPSPLAGGLTTLVAGR